uniref:cytochrome c oxidase subunit II n=1 Tax=Bolbosoma nipponicum TaxID=1167864 RepID=UPI002E7939D7|nr:cytochrome c oxidase subunit II [Bolbosoma nipponicum]WPN89838.1 cytochrome c oxidase subunit II [Bolbosoma nipponicum]
MMHWGNSGLTDGFSLFMEGAVQFNDYVMGLSLFIFWFVVVLVVMESVKYGRGGDRDVGSVFLLEFVWTLLPMILLVFMAYPSMVLLYMSDVTPDCDVSVVIVAHQWYWEYFSGTSSFDSYMLGVAETGFRLLDVDNRLVVPSFESVSLSTTSADVIHSWAVPALGVKVDCIPGRLNQITTEILGCGVFYGQCSELCGVLHSFMPIVVEAVSLGDFMF